MNKFLIAGLGNVGTEYNHTRHNIGFDILDKLVLKYNEFFTNQRLAMVANLKIKGRQLVCIKPTTYMNLSGKAVKYWMEKEKIPVENILVIVDDLALPLSKLRLRGKGSAAGHNGLTDIELTLGTSNYPKLRFGIGNNYPKGMQVNFVLGKWQSNELEIVNRKIEKSVEAIEMFVLEGLSNTMNKINNIEF